MYPVETNLKLVWGNRQSPEYMEHHKHTIEQLNNILAQLNPYPGMEVSEIEYYCVVKITRKGETKEGDITRIHWLAG